MNGKDYLSQLQLLDVKIDQKIQELDELKRLISIKAVDYSREKVQTNVCHNADFENTIIKINTSNSIKH